MSSLASTKRLEEYRLGAIEYYFRFHADNSKIRCIVTGNEIDFEATAARHIYRQSWPTGVSVSIFPFKVMERCSPTPQLALKGSHLIVVPVG